MSQAWITLATNDNYAQGALVLVHSLRTAGTTRKIHCLISNQSASNSRSTLMMFLLSMSSTATIPITSS
ncbi:hypothetical protein CAEBREN_21678 [Caenorhabditis brenneri]|uniref:Uncharacterized protein n=1 Tax=Caenorhabditis brenneri TaxID=135651 RepID=G0M7P4_CAEBE|nr:hypothetical protein CAEBREN_21678 [Caenorhabditis brenneri]